MRIPLIEVPGDVTPSKLLPYSMMGLAGLIILYSFTSGSKNEVHDVEEEVEEDIENEQDVK